MIVTDSSLKPASWCMDHTMTPKGGKCPRAWTASKCVKLMDNIATQQPTHSKIKTQNLVNKFDGSDDWMM